MAAEKTDVLLIGPPKPVIVNGLAGPFNLIKLSDAKDPEKLFAETAPRVRAIAVSGTEQRVNGAFMTRFPKLEIVSSFGVGYDHVDAGWAGKHGITVTNTPDVLTEEVADTALGLLLCTVREFPQAERYVRAGKWAQKGYPLSKATLRNRTVGMVGLGRIGQAIARRLEAMQVPVVYHSRRPATGVSYRHYPKLIDMARDVDVLLVITPGGAETKNLINAEVLGSTRPRRHPHQHGARLGGRRGGADQGAAGQDHPVRRSRRLCARARSAGRADRHGSRRAVPPSRLGVGGDAREDGPAGGGQSARLGGGQTAADAGGGDAVATEEALVNPG